MALNNPLPEPDSPFSKLLGLGKKQKLTSKQQFGKDLLEIAKRFPVDNPVDKPIDN